MNEQRGGEELYVEPTAGSRLLAKMQGLISPDKLDSICSDYDESLDVIYEALKAQRDLTAAAKDRGFREWLFASHGCGLGYCDDGELQCGMHLPPIDFKRDSLRDIGIKTGKHAQAECQAKLEQVFAEIEDCMGYLNEPPNTPVIRSLFESDWQALKREWLKEEK